MADTYRVTIVRESGSGDDYETETLFEVAGKIGMIVRVAPGALIDALTEAGEDVPVALVDRVMSSAVAGLPATHPFGEQAPQPRKRRTKQQMAEDKLRDEQAARLAEVPPQALAETEPQAEPMLSATEAPAPAAEPAPLPPSSEDGPTPQYNPFAVN